jgi:inner membrane protein
VEETATVIASFLPETLNITGDAETQMLHRGIYEAAVFRADVKLSGKFAPSDFGAPKIDLKGVQWNDAVLKSSWPDSAFRGAFLPTERAVRGDGFDAKWKVSYYGRSYPQSWTSQTGNERFTTQTVSQSMFGTQFLSILEAYRYVERSIKYGVLFLILVFTTFFLFEVTARQTIHPLQYLMVGAALCLFYLLLLSISEFIGFGFAYLVAAAASIMLITSYGRCFLGSGVRTLVIGAGLAGVYTFLYITLRQQDYALLMGEGALFVLLAIVMYVTRKIDWYARDAS